MTLLSPSTDNLAFSIKIPPPSEPAEFSEIVVLPFIIKFVLPILEPSPEI